MESPLSPPSPCPIGNLPYDVLREIFTHCVPLHPRERNDGEYIFNNTPVVLSHVCSSWRVVAHSSPILWCYLSYRVILEDPGTRWLVRKRDVELIRWWRERHGGLHPFVVMDAVFWEPVEQDQLADEDAVAYILEYLTSAQYLDIDLTFWDELNYRKLACPNLHTLVLDGHEDYDLEAAFWNAQSVISLVAGSPLRRLSLYDGSLYQENSPGFHETWASLTHIALQSVTISLDFWFNLFSAVPALQWAYANISEVEVEHENSVCCVMSQLSSLFLITRDCDISVALSGLRLPALRTLSISSTYMTRETERAVDLLHQILKTAPKITTLALGEYLLSVDGRNFNFSSTTNLSLRGAVPLWKNTPHLTHLYLERPFHYSVTTEDAEYKLQEFSEHVFLTRADWLGLDKSECPISTVTLVDVEIEKVGDAILSLCGELGERSGNISVQFAKTSLDQQAWESVKEWGSMI
ncbi:hypothetical protein BDN70DRAFT_998739 [Pholiota conissans]|uniref:F-box domain-containing protein n=1 Tax=Pholiota conissans TaxID=109636 RepID=A0A9P6CSI7_9AGAR|nr:hypothetical protein BDN70DRAFT_998739 [Pholiota conissans]